MAGTPSIKHPLAVGTRVYYEDLDGGWGWVTHNDPTTPAFKHAAAQFFGGKHVGPAFDADYIVNFDDLGPIPVQRAGILRVARPTTDASEGFGYWPGEDTPPRRRRSWGE